jgi:hypothetical protein
MTRKIVLKRAPWQVDDIREILGGTMDPKSLLEHDNKGLSPVAFSALKSAIATDSLLSLLEEKLPAEENPIQQIKNLLESIAVAQVRLEDKLDRLTEALLASD